MWKEWKQAILLTFPLYNHRLVQPVGKWTIPDKQWNSFIDSSTRDLFIRHQHHWLCFRRNRAVFSGDNNVFLAPTYSRAPRNRLKAIAWVDDEGNPQYHGYFQSETRPQPNDSLIVKVNDQLHSPHSQWLFQWATDLSIESILQIAHAIKHRHAIGVTDGSFKEGRGAAGFCILKPSIWKAACQVPGTENIQCSYRSELCGILGILMAVKAITDATDTKHGQITIGCNNLLAGQHAIEWNRFPSPSNGHFDILQRIHLI